jgi:hypothetical protein
VKLVLLDFIPKRHFSSATSQQLDFLANFSLRFELSFSKIPNSAAKPRKRRDEPISLRENLWILTCSEVETVANAEGFSSHLSAETLHAFVPFNSNIIRMEEPAEPTPLSLPLTQFAEASCECTPQPPKLALLGRQKKCRNLFTLVEKERMKISSEGSTADSSPYLGP